MMFLIFIIELRGFCMNIYVIKLKLRKVESATDGPNARDGT